MKHIPVLASLLIATSVFATPSGLNNIPTADTPPQGTVVVQAWTDFGNGHNEDFNMGFKTGLDVLGQKLEFGADSHLTPGLGGPVVLQFKYVHDLWEGGKVAVGVANLALSHRDMDRAGDPFSYALISQDVGGMFRIHAGYGFQTDNDSVLLGLDKTVKFLNRDLQVRTDFIQVQNQGQWEGSVGCLYVLYKNLVLEAWASQPLDHGSAIYTAKLNFVFNF